jgi:hypothetical protein
MKEKKSSQTELARRFGIPDPASISHWVCGRKTVTSGGMILGRLVTGWFKDNGGDISLLSFGHTNTVDDGASYVDIETSPKPTTKRGAAEMVMETPARRIGVTKPSKQPRKKQKLGATGSF